MEEAHPQISAVVCGSECVEAIIPVPLWPHYRSKPEMIGDDDDEANDDDMVIISKSAFSQI